MLKSKKHILVVRLSAMGDVAICVPVIKAFVRLYPNVKITVLTRSFFNPFFEKIPNITVFNPDLNAKHKGFFGIQRLSKELVDLNIDAVADLHDVLRSNILIRTLQLKGIPFQQIDKGRADKKALTNNKFFTPLQTSLERYVNVFKKLEFTIDVTPNDVLEKLPFPKNFKKENKKLIGIAPFAAHKGKMYPLDKMKIVIEELSKDNQIVLFGGGDQEVAKLIEIEKSHKNVISVAGIYSFKEELAILSNLDLMLAMDSGNGHLAAMYGVSVFTIWGVTHPFAGFTPFNQPFENQIIPDLEKYPLIPTSIYGNKYPEGYLDCFETIFPDVIINSIKKALR